MIIRSAPLQFWIDYFYGYGSWKARVWFVGYEEGGGDTPEEVAAKLNYFSETHSSASGATLCDIRDLYSHIPSGFEGDKAKTLPTLHEYRFGRNATLHGYWKNMIAFEAAYHKEKQPDLLQYQKKKFAMPSLEREAWLPLYPLPSTHNHAWYYSWLDLPEFDFLKSRTNYEDHVYLSRINTILSKIKEHQPELVLFYGMDNIAMHKESVQRVFPNANFKSVKGEKQVIPHHHRAELGSTLMLITTQIPALHHNRVESGYDWEKFGALTRSLSDK